YSDCCSGFTREIRRTEIGGTTTSPLAAVTKQAHQLSRRDFDLAFEARNVFDQCLLDLVDLRLGPGIVARANRQGLGIHWFSRLVLMFDRYRMHRWRGLV